MLRFFSPVLLCVACAPVSLVPRTSAPPIPCPQMTDVQESVASNPSAAASAPPGPALPAPTPVDPDAVRDARALTSVFRKHLKALRDCPKPKREPLTWVDVDTLELENLDAGRFVPVILRRERGHFDENDAEQIRYLVRIDNCQSNTSTLHIEAVFSEDSLSSTGARSLRRPRPAMVRESHVSNSHPTRQAPAPN
jgi:hypothetical protein